MKLTAKLKKAIQKHASEIYPEECCGVIINREYHRCENVAADASAHFEIDPQQLAKLEDMGEIQAYVHSHPDGTALASPFDKQQIELHGKPWVICAYPDVEFQVHMPCGYVAPLIGRNYHHGWQDCYSLVRDFYQREFSIELLDFERNDKWWEEQSNASLYLENYAKAGFYEVSEMQYGDLILCKVHPTVHVNHALIWLGDNGQLKSEPTDPCFGTTLFLHHPYNQPSAREIYGKNWAERTSKIIRHKDLL